MHQTKVNRWPDKTLNRALACGVEKEKEMKKAIVLWSKGNVQIVQGDYPWIVSLVGEQNILFVFI